MKRFASWPGHAWIALPVRVYLAAIFLLACYHKILDPHAFALDVATYQILPLALVNLMAIVLPWIELATGVMLLVGLRTRPAALLIAGMMVVFTMALSIALAKGLDMSCGCFASQGADEDPISWTTLVRDAVWLAMAAYVLFFDKRPLGLDRLLERRGPPVAAQPNP
ncbi:MAG TPA: DoxX family protein [Myxococcales bacterium]|jgi:uncharacterized membrane protein YphA (DoxX/SURF4 family)|nr:DoxX family protein [Myxococcales bacterium]